MVVIITGPAGCGKTSCLTRLAEQWKQKHIRIDGILAPSVTRNNDLRQYNLRFIATGRELPFASSANNKNSVQTGKFYFNSETLATGKRYLASIPLDKTDILIMDEIGPLELEGKMWANEFSAILASDHPVLVVSMRPAIVQQALKKWKLKGSLIIECRQKHIEEIFNIINDLFNNIK